MNIDFWGAKDEERLVHKDIDDAIEEILDNHNHPWPETITVCGFEREKVSLEYLKGRLVDFALEELDEDYRTSDAYGDGSGSTPKMLEAEEVFIEAIVSEYTPYDCEITTEVVVPVTEWIENHQNGLVCSDTLANSFSITLHLGALATYLLLNLEFDLRG